MTQDFLSNLERRRYQKQLDFKSIGEEGQLKLKNLSVLVVGAGALGIPILQYLTSMGVGTIGIMDNDLIFEHNLPGQMLYNIKDLGKHKAIMARSKLQDINDLVKYNIHNICLNPQNAIGFLQPYDFIVDATDILETKYIINDACVILKKPWIFICNDRLIGRYSLFDGKSGPTLRCLFDSMPDLPDKIHDSVDLGIAAGIAGTLGAGEIFKWALGIESDTKGHLISIDMLNNSFEKMSISINQKHLNIKSL